MSTKKDHHYQAQIRVEAEIIYLVDGNDINDLMILIQTKLASEKSGAIGEIIDLTSGNIIQRCIKTHTEQ